jgi:hypothetical protein
MHVRSILSCLTLCLALSLASTVHAQRPVQQVVDLNRQAMEAYNNLEMEQAQALLTQARELAQRAHVTGAPLARTLMNLGVVAIGGQGDNGAGLDFFVRALEADPNVQLDPLSSTPDIQTTFALARQRRGAGGSGVVITPTPTPTPTPTGTPEPTSTSETDAISGIQHSAPAEQLVQTPLPLFAEFGTRPAHVYLYYRATGMRDFRRVEMTSVGRGYGYEIPCSDVFEPSINYYIVGFGADGTPLAFAGSQAAPLNVPIVTTRTTTAPALPGRAPPAQCVERECPPGMTCAGGAELGETCSRNSDCSSNHCVDNMCAASGGSSSSGAPRFFARVGVGIAMSYVPQGLEADRTPCAVGDVDCIDYAKNPVQEIEGYPDLPASGAPPVPIDPNQARAQGYEPASGSYEAGGPDSSTNCNLSLDGGFANAACLYVRDPGMVANLQLRVEVGYYFIDWFGISAFGRFSPFSGLGTLSWGLFGLRANFRVFDEGHDDGPSVAVHLGGSVGQIQVQVPNNGPNAPWGTTGLGGIHVGGTFTYRFTRNVGIFVNPDFMFQLPKFLFNTDLTVGLEAGF